MAKTEIELEILTNEELVKYVDECFDNEDRVSMLTALKLLRARLAPRDTFHKGWKINTGEMPTGIGSLHVEVTFTGGDIHRDRARYLRWDISGLSEDIRLYRLV